MSEIAGYFTRLSKQTVEKLVLIKTEVILISSYWVKT